MVDWAIKLMNVIFICNFVDVNSCVTVFDKSKKLLNKQLVNCNGNFVSIKKFTATSLDLSHSVNHHNFQTFYFLTHIKFIHCH